MVAVRRLWLEQFRNYEHLALELPAGPVLVVGANGQGKSNLAEALGWLGTLTSFRGATTETLVRVGAPAAIIRAEVQREERELLIEAQLVPGKQIRAQVNRQRLGRSRELVGLVPTTVFAPDDLELVKGGPAPRRDYLDDLLVQLHPRHARVRAELDRILRQRNAVLRQSGGRRTPEIEATLVVWNAKLAETGDEWGTARATLVERLGPHIRAAYRQLAGSGEVDVHYRAPWRQTGLAAALAAVADDELRRGVTLVGPHRDELDLILDTMPARTHASQGEQRTLALALRMAGHVVTREATATAPLLVLDDVFSELDDRRAGALLDGLDAEQTVITSADRRPATATPMTVLEIVDGQLRG